MIKHSNYIIKKYTPKYCPNCGNKFGNKSKNSNYKMESENLEGDILFDCYCKTCKWQGEISPDRLLISAIGLKYPKIIK